jgi:hypothetical protein
MSNSTALATVIERIEGAELLSPTDLYGIRFNIPNTDGSRSYTIALCIRGKDKGVWKCSCPSWVTRRRCKHMTAMLPSLEMIENASGGSF